MIKKEEADKLMQMKGEVRGVVFQTDAEYVRAKKGKEGLEEVKEQLKKLGYPINYEEARAMEWFPIGLRALSLLVIKDTFNWNDEEIEMMGNTAPKYSFIMKMLMRYFVSTEQTLKFSPKYWGRHYSVGELEIAEFHDKEKYAIVRVKDFKMPPPLTKYLEGYFCRVLEYTLPGQKVKGEQQKFTYKGDPYDEYRFFWGK